MRLCESLYTSLMWPAQQWNKSDSTYSQCSQFSVLQITKSSDSHHHNRKWNTSAVCWPWPTYAILKIDTLNYLFVSVVCVCDLERVQCPLSGWERVTHTHIHTSLCDIFVKNDSQLKFELTNDGMLQSPVVAPHRLHFKHQYLKSSVFLSEHISLIYSYDTLPNELNLSTSQNESKRKLVYFQLFRISKNGISGATAVCGSVIQ